MISRRLTEMQKSEILKAYMAGGNTNVLAEKYKCTPNTINRTVKTLLSDDEYKLLKKKRSKISNKNEKSVKNKTLKEKKTDLEQANSSISFKEKANDEVLVNEKTNKESDNNASLCLRNADDFGENFDYQNVENNFEEIAPLISSFDFEIEKQKLNFEILDYESLPESVYMIVDKKVELELQPISDLPEWSFLPEKELQRNAILLFSTQRSAKRICSRNQRVIKIPNTNVFELSKSYLISKGITRLILEDSIIGLDH
tara:strand:- start:681 stop:1451 length:771 start_codon:yes stop_codon:yes gene_type:complete